MKYALVAVALLWLAGIGVVGTIAVLLIRWLLQATAS